ncbi:MAG: MbnH family di-heme enzyme [Acidobacteriota bacterium]
MRALITLALCCVGCLCCTGCGAPQEPWQVPAGFPALRVPADNPMSAATIELGRHLFYDEELSANRTQSCASCHIQALAFTDGRTHGVGSTGERHRRNTSTLTNVGYAASLTWANPLITTLEQQAHLPLFGDEPFELALESPQQLVERLAARPELIDLFERAFPDEADPLTIFNVTRALAAFQRSLISADSPYDRYLAGEPSALSASQQRGLRLFQSERLECFHCHGGFNFSDSLDHSGMPTAHSPFHNTGLYDLADGGGYPQRDRGLFEITLDERDRGAFKAPTLRNVEVTAPYMHDGSMATLDEVLDHYEQGGRRIDDGPYAGDGSGNPHKSDFVSGFVLTEQEREDLLAFLRGLTDTTFLTNPQLSDPQLSDPQSFDPRLSERGTSDSRRSTPEKASS